MSFDKPIYVKFIYKNGCFEGEYIPDKTDYFSPKGVDNNIMTTPNVGYIRPFNRDLRQAIIYRNIDIRRMDYEDWMSLADVDYCDAFVTSELLCRPSGDNELLVKEFKFVSREELVVNQYEIDLCRVDIVHRMFRLLRNMEGSDQDLIIKLKEIFFSLNIENYVPLSYRKKTSGFFYYFEKIFYGSFELAMGIVFLGWLLSLLHKG